ncbi:kinase-like domain-containing protein [Podospora conica]|nr:kinase-like domain-containing protein [Schizothecium conicum]
MSSGTASCLVIEDRSSLPARTGTVWVLPNKTIRFGRDADNKKNQIVFNDPAVSRNHFEIYCVVVDEENRHKPLVFVRDRQSSNGTFVNGQLIGKGPSISPGWLLQDGDLITVPPYIFVTLSQRPIEPPFFSLTSHQRQEALLFEDRYVISDRTIGDGAHATVYLAIDVKTGKQVVCKVHDLAKVSRAPRKLERIRQEAILLSYLDHPNILSFRAAFQTQQTLYIFTDFATGGDLFSLIHKYDTFEEVEIRWILRQVLSGVVYIHGKGVAHRDIKPENILCAIAPDAAYRVLLSDFGDSAMASRGRMKSHVGTTIYRAPECHSPEIGHGLSVDIWAIGMLALQLFTGMEEIPHLHTMNLNNQEAIDKYLQHVFHHLNQHSGISEGGKQFLRACLTYDKEERPTARQLLKNRWLKEPYMDNGLFKQLENESIAPWTPRGVVLPAIEDLWVENTENVGGEPAQSRAASDEAQVSHHFGQLQFDGDLSVEACQPEPSPEPTEVANGKDDESHQEGTTREFVSLPQKALGSAAREAKLGSKRRLDLLHAGRPKRCRLFSI